jgi:D-beta-D-heptose 7-phosphate kinase/D-beta-D-heptose 1-phosphate adenosyltransferase
VIEALRPNVIVKGGDYSEETVVGAQEVRSWGGRVKIVPTVEGFSTTKLIARALTNSSDAAIGAAGHPSSGTPQ